MENKYLSLHYDRNFVDLDVYLVKYKIMFNLD